MADRAQKVLAGAGYGSRREIERWIAAGKLKINGQTASLGACLEGDEEIELNGKPISIKASQNTPHSHLMYHKPVGEVCSRKDPEGRRIVFDSLPKPGPGRWISVGRLDIATSGLLLLTTDGELANRLMHPSYEVQRRYAVRVLGAPDAQVQQQLMDGVELEDGKAAFSELVEAGGEGVNRWFEVALKEGRNREVRRMWEAVGFKVSRLMRIAYGPVHLAQRLSRGRYQDLTRSEVVGLYKCVGLEPPTAPGRVDERRLKGKQIRHQGQRR